MASLAGWASLGQQAFIQRAASSSPSDSTDPKVIVIFGWMSAKLSHLHKYTVQYRELYPFSTIVLVRSTLSLFWTSAGGTEARFRPVIAALEALECFDDHQRILTHSFSNGGGLHVATLAKMISARTPRTLRSGPSALVIDSAPGGASLQKTMTAVTAPIRNKFLKRLAKGGFVLWWFFMMLLGRLLNRPQPLVAMMKALRNPRLLPWIDERSPRLYIYSNADQMVPAADVEEHAAQSASEGLDVRQLRFDKSAHVEHARVYPGEYWAAIQKLWTDACQVKR
ncbi:hypothetical protein R3P38DRAFT_2918692 [Favolaschia claudopus]|uniref:Transmembrane protein 53 n=1 Tax=Favolaschia claudopus TaxID=2862362 RepID=A0AAW0C207_9AGAR